MAETPDPARARFLTLSLLRLGGVLLIMVGLLISAGKLAGLPAWTGTLLTIVGAIDFIFVPRLLARRWRSPAP